MQIETSKKLLRVTEAAQVIQGSKRFVEEEISAGRLAVVRLSRKFVRIRPEDLDAYIERYVIGGAAK